MSSMRFVLAILLVLLAIFFASTSQEILSRPTRPEKIRDEEIQEFIRKYKAFLDRSANPRYGKRFSSPLVRKMNQEIYPNDLEDIYGLYKNYDNLF